MESILWQGKTMWNNHIIIGGGRYGVVEALLTTLVLVVYWRITLWGKGNYKRFPPGPWGWPITGHLHLFSHLAHQALRDVAAKYGPIIGLRLGQRRAVVISSPELAREVLLTQDKVFANRPPHQFTSELFFKDAGILFSYQGPEWRKRRKTCAVELFTAKRLQELEYVRQEEMAAFLQRIADKSEGGTTAVDFGDCVGQMSSRIIMRLLQSEAASQVGGETLHDLVDDVVQQISPTVGDLIPWLSWLDFGRRKRSMRAVHARIDKTLTAVLAERKAQSCARSYDDLLQALLSKEAAQASCDHQSNSSSTATPAADALTLAEIKAIMLDMLAAGIHTTSLTLEWAMAELLKNPHCLHRLQKEVDSVALSSAAAAGRKKQITDADVAKLSYLKCIAKEVFRLHPAGPLLVPRISTEECKVDGYIIPPDTLMFINVWAIGRDERVWPDATRFMPERFIGKDTDVKGLHYDLLPFGSGRRVCMGLLLGLSIVELTLANIVNRFDWELPPGETPASLNMDEKTGIALNRATPILAVPKPRQIM